MNIRYPIYEGVYRILTLYFVEPVSCICFIIRNGFFAGSAETLPALLFLSFFSPFLF